MERQLIYIGIFCFVKWNLQLMNRRKEKKRLMARVALSSLKNAVWPKESPSCYACHSIMLATEPLTCGPLKGIPDANHRSVIVFISLSYNGPGGPKVCLSLLAPLASWCRYRLAFISRLSTYRKEGEIPKTCIPLHAKNVVIWWGLKLAGLVVTWLIKILTYYRIESRCW